MGRPRKKQKTEERTNQSQYPQQIEALPLSPPSISNLAQHSGNTPSFEEIRIDTLIDPSLAAIDHDRTSFTNICNGPIAQSIRDSRDSGTRDEQVAHYSSNTSFLPNSIDGTSAQDTPYAQYPLDIASWPDFSTLESLPMPLQDSNPVSSSYLSPPYTTSVDGTYHDPDVDPAALQDLPAVPACPCLPNLYLTLSTLSTSSVYPVTSHTIETLLAAQKTAHSVIYCHICPQKFQSGSQNLMLSCTLLNVLADHWHRVRRCSPEDLKKGFGKSDVNINISGTQPFISAREGQAWRSFVYTLIRAYVFGDKPIPNIPQSSPQTDASILGSPERESTHQTNTIGKSVPREFVLSFLIDAIRRRQRQWHCLDEPTDEFPDRAHCAYPEIYKSHDHNHRKHHKNINGANSNGNEDKPNDSHRQVQEQQEEQGSAPQQPDEPIQNENEKEEGDHVLCLMIVKHSMEIIQSLNDDYEA